MLTRKWELWWRSWQRWTGRLVRLVTARRRKAGSASVLAHVQAPAQAKMTAAAANGLALDDTARATLVHEIEAAHAQWAVALAKLDYVVGEDEVDYAIFALEAAEKRYEMLLKQAKQLGVTAPAPVAAQERGRRT